MKDELMHGAPHVHFMNATSQDGCKWIYLQPGLSTLSGRLELQKQPCAVILDGHSTHTEPRAHRFGKRKRRCVALSAYSLFS